MNFLRRVFMVACAGGGVWLAYYLIGRWASATGEQDFHLTPEGVPLLLPVGIVGALVGAFVGGLLLPVRR